MPEFLSRDAVEPLIRRAFDEDLLPDITSEAIFDPSQRGRARFIAKAEGVFCGLIFAETTFALLDPTSSFRPVVKDGTPVKPRDVLAEVEAGVIALLSGERTALNFIQRASGIATATRRYVDAVSGTGAKIYDTRKTAPGLRLLDKFAVRCGGGENHRYGLHDMFLVKNNHIDAAGSITAALERIRGRQSSVLGPRSSDWRWDSPVSTGSSEDRSEDRGPRTEDRVPIMVEVRDLAELDEALSLKPDFILLDNMSTETMAEAVRRTAGKIPLEASGGVTLQNIRAIAETGVDRISVGGLTHSVTGLDISMRVE
ncbi:MAG TPA: carboxylating nicotinate-nucleotide diphosphorylase [Thermoanaerobaculia bacterium]|nr:carboxylating nicotinate-nucleotide diphosphorylase [Thermoanaerobaculia bacterium]